MSVALEQEKPKTILDYFTKSKRGHGGPPDNNDWIYAGIGICVICILFYIFKIVIFKN